MPSTKRYSAAILTNKTSLLLGKRSETRKEYPGFWDLLGGHCKKHESFEQAMLRELKEETGLTATHYSLWKTVDHSPEFIMAVFHVTEWTGTLNNGEPAEHDEVRWFPYQDAVTLNFPDPEYLQLIEEIFLALHNTH